MPSLRDWYTPEDSAWCINAPWVSRLTRAALSWLCIMTIWLHSTLKHYVALSVTGLRLAQLQLSWHLYKWCGRIQSMLIVNACWYIRYAYICKHKYWTLISIASNILLTCSIFSGHELLPYQNTSYPGGIDYNLPIQMQLAGSLRHHTGLTYWYPPFADTQFISSSKRWRMEDG